MKKQIMQKMVVALTGAVLLSSAGFALAYDASWTKAQCDTYSYHGLGERYVFGGDLGWIDNNVWDDPSTEGLDCSSYVPRCWAIDGPGDSYLGEHTAGSHPYSTYDFYPGNVPHTIMISQASLQPWDCWVYSYQDTQCGPGNHMGLAKSVDASNVYTREMRGSGYGGVEVTRSKQSLTDACTRYFRRADWGGATTIIVDNANGGFTCSANWATGTMSTDKYASNYRYRSAAPVSDQAVFTANLPSSGTWTVYVWYPQGSNRSSVTPFIISTSGGNHTEIVNQQIAGGQWVNQGSYNMNAGNNTVKVSCWVSTGYVVVADAVKWVK